MNKYQKALNKLREEADWYTSEMCGVDGTWDELETSTDKTEAVLQELVDKATITKHLKSKYDNMCPNCKGSTLEQEDNANYCHQCGQAIDWSE